MKTNISQQNSPITSPLHSPRVTVQQTIRPVMPKMNFAFSSPQKIELKEEENTLRDPIKVSLKKCPSNSNSHFYHKIEPSR